MSALEIGGHVDDPIEAAHRDGFPIAQTFIGDPQAWKGHAVAHPGGAAGLKVDAEAAGVGLFIHAPYVINVATTNNRIRIPSCQILARQVKLATEVGRPWRHRARRARHGWRRSAGGLRQLAQGDRGARLDRPDLHREHRGRHQLHGPPPGADRSTMGDDLRREGRASRTSASASTPATRTRAASTRQASWTPSRASPDASIWSTSTTLGTPRLWRRPARRPRTGPVRGRLPGRGGAPGGRPGDPGDPDHRGLSRRTDRLAARAPLRRSGGVFRFSRCSRNMNT